MALTRAAYFMRRSVREAGRIYQLVFPGVILQYEEVGRFTAALQGLAE
jgi:hypothetical protein